MSHRPGEGASTTQRRVLYPVLDPFRTGSLRVSEVHELYFEESGNPNGFPALFLHGGPGSGTEPSQRRFFDPTFYRIVLFDQRGAGKSRPQASLVDNTTWHLVQDIEALRQHLGFERFLLFGGSWGSTLALAYAQAHPERVAAMVLRGIFLMSRKELLWFYQEGASCIFPDAWEEFLRPIPEEERHDLMGAYARRLHSEEPHIRKAAAHAWSLWEAKCSRLYEDPALIERFTGEHFALAFARIENHYFQHRGFLRSDFQLVEDVHKIRHIPAVIVQGRYDIVCPMESAWLLHRAWPEAAFHIVPDAGHSATEPGTAHELVSATDRMRAVVR